MKKLHLGCGSVIHPGWDNLDIAPPPGGIVCDLRKPLPYGANSVDFIFHEHFIEHLDRDQGVRLLKECYRVLKPGGVMRISTPDLLLIAQDYLDNFLSRYVGTWEPSTPAQLLNGAMRLWDHKFLFDITEIAYACSEAGFTKFDMESIGSIQMQYRKSHYPELRNLETRPDYEDLIVEFKK